MKSIFTKQKLKVCLLSALTYFAVLQPFRYLFSLIPHVTEIRVAAFMPPVFGIMFGAAGAAGIFVGNFISDIISGDLVFSALAGSAVNFIFSYTTYKLWHTFFVKDSSPSLYNVRSITKYIAIVIFNSLAISFCLMTLIEFTGYVAARDSFWLFFFNGFDFSVILGIPVLLLFSGAGIKPLTPASVCVNKKKLSHARVDRLLFDALPFCVIVMGFSYLVFSYASAEVLPTVAGIAFLILFVLSGLYLFRPVPTRTAMEDEKRQTRFSITSKITAGFLTLIIASIFFSVAVAVYAYKQYGFPVIWEQVSVIIALAISVLLLSTIGYLRYIERKITRPVLILSEIVHEFAARDHANEASNDSITAYETLTGLNNGDDEIGTLSASVKKMMEDTEAYIKNLETSTKERARLDAELDIAAIIQKGFLPPDAPPPRPAQGFDLRASMFPAKKVGGDFYDFFPLGDDALAFVIGDVSGKGVPAALFMVATKMCIKNFALSGKTPAEVFFAANNALCEKNDADMFVTAWFGVLRTSTGVLTYVNAGHNPPLVRRGAGYEYLNDEPQLALAVSECVTYVEREINVRGDDTVFLYTDGVTEAADVDGRLFGAERLRDLVNLVGSRTDLETLLKKVKEEVFCFAKGAVQSDDITMLSVRYTGAEGTQSKTFAARGESLQAALSFIRESLDLDTYPKRVAMRVELASEEAFSNIANYAYAGSAMPVEDRTVTVLCQTERGNVMLRFIDNGAAFNPLSAPVPDLEGSANERCVGGLGVHLLKNCAERLDYAYVDSQNVFTLYICVHE